jgi:hypothetical protein
MGRTREVYVYVVVASKTSASSSAVCYLVQCYKLIYMTVEKTQSSKFVNEMVPFSQL